MGTYDPFTHVLTTAHMMCGLWTYAWLWGILVFRIFRQTHDTESSLPTVSDLPPCGRYAILQVPWACTLHPIVFVNFAGSFAF